MQLYDLSLAASGLTRAGAERRGLTVRETSLTEDYRPDFMLTTTPVTSILTWDPETRKVKGGQFCSKADISGAANVISMAIQAASPSTSSPTWTSCSSRTSTSPSITWVPWP